MIFYNLNIVILFYIIYIYKILIWDYKLKILKSKIKGFDIKPNLSSSRIIDILINDDLINHLTTSFNKFDLETIEYKPFTRFTIAKIIDEYTENKLSKLLNIILKDRNMGCIKLEIRKKIKKLVKFY